MVAVLTNGVTLPSNFGYMGITRVADMGLTGRTLYSALYLNADTVTYIVIGTSSSLLRLGETRPKKDPARFGLSVFTAPSTISPIWVSF